MRRKYPDTVQGQLQMSDWCRDHNLPAQRKKHLERVLQLDPDQAEARRLLNYRKVKEKWMTLEEEMADQGKVNGRQRPLADAGGGRDPRRRKSKTRPRVNGSRRLPAGRSGWAAAGPRPGAKNLRAIDDPMAIAGLAERLVKKPDPRTEARLIFVDVLGHIQRRKQGPRPRWPHVRDRRSGGRSPPDRPG